MCEGDVARAYVGDGVLVSQADAVHENSSPDPQFRGHAGLAHGEARARKDDASFEAGEHRPELPEGEVDLLSPVYALLCAMK